VKKNPVLRVAGMKQYRLESSPLSGEFVVVDLPDALFGIHLDVADRVWAYRRTTTRTFWF